MRECSYWWKADDEERCDMADMECPCHGLQHDCPLGGSAIERAVKVQQRFTLQEAARRARRAHREQEAS